MFAWTLGSHCAITATQSGPCVGPLCRRRAASDGQDRHPIVQDHGLFEPPKGIGRRHIPAFFGEVFSHEEYEVHEGPLPHGARGILGSSKWKVALQPSECEDAKELPGFDLEAGLSVSPRNLRNARLYPGDDLAFRDEVHDDLAVRIHRVQRGSPPPAHLRVLPWGRASAVGWAAGCVRPRITFRPRTSTARSRPQRNGVTQRRDCQQCRVT